MKNLSYSSAGEFEKCSYRYHLKYDRNMWINTTADALELGSICHEAIELYLEDLQRGVENPAPPVKRVDAVLLSRYPTFPIAEHLESLKEIARDYYKLYMRAAPTYVGPDAIRKRDGDPTDSPEMTGIWKSEVKRLGLDARCLAFDQIIWGLEPMTWAGVSFTNAYVQAMVILSKFRLPPDFKQVIAIEFPLSETVYYTHEDGSPVFMQGKKVLRGIRNEVRFPGMEVPFKGFIDLVYEDVFGEIRILDWKTSRKCPEHTDVMFWDQPNLYAHFYRDLTGVPAARIEIAHLRSGFVASSPVSWTQVAHTVERYSAIVEAIQKQAYRKQSPTEYGTECMREFKGQLTICPYLVICHPEFARAKGLMPED